MAKTSMYTLDKQLRMTNKSHNEIYIVTANDSPNVLKEIGQLQYHYHQYHQVLLISLKYLYFQGPSQYL